VTPSRKDAERPHETEQKSPNNGAGRLVNPPSTAATSALTMIPPHLDMHAVKRRQ